MWFLVSNSLDNSCKTLPVVWSACTLQPKLLGSWGKPFVAVGSQWNAKGGNVTFCRSIKILELEERRICGWIPQHKASYDTFYFWYLWRETDSPCYPFQFFVSLSTSFFLFPFSHSFSHTQFQSPVPSLAFSSLTGKAAVSCLLSSVLRHRWGS